MSFSQDRWSALWRRLGLQGSPEKSFRRLRRAHRQWWRAYHGIDHVAECLMWLDTVMQEAPGALDEPDLVEAAIWFHDAVYVPWLPRNEERSASWAEKALSRAGLSEDRVSTVRELISATLHREPPTPGDTRWLVDIDLSILGAEASRFAQYERQIRKEYRWVRAARFRDARATVLKSFLDRPNIYATDFFRRRLEDRARQNLREAIARLS